MPQLALVKVASALFAPLAANDEIYVVEKCKIGDVIRAEFTKARNARFHRKYMGLLNMAFDYFEPPMVKLGGQWVRSEKNFDEFRYWLAIQAGFYNIIGYPDGSVRTRAKSISFANMDDDQFRDLYSSTINVLLRSVLKVFKTPEAVERATNQIMNYC